MRENPNNNKMEIIPKPKKVKAPYINAFFDSANWIQYRVYIFLVISALTIVAMYRILSMLDDSFNSASWKFWVAICLSIIPLLVSFFGFIVPKYIANRKSRNRITNTKPNYFRLLPYNENETNAFSRPDNAHIEALNWVSRSNISVLYMYGVSGSGKSSIINAYILPKLPESYVAIQLRASINPLITLRDELLKEGGIWKVDRQIEHMNIGIEDLLEKVNDQLLRRKCTLLIVFDQFEELPTHIESISNNEKDDLLNCLKSISYGKYSSIKILYSLMSESLGYIAKYGLTPFDTSKAFFVDCFSQEDSKIFLEGGFDGIGRNRLMKVIHEASLHDNLSGRIRPITLNMVGLMLKNTPLNTSDIFVGTRPFNKYFRNILNESSISDLAPELLQKLIDNNGRRLQKKVNELAILNYTAYDIDACLLILSTADRGLTRCLNQHEKLVTEKVWEISHDFVASILVTVLDSLPSRFWRNVKRWMFPSIILISPMALIAFWNYVAIFNRNTVVAKLSSDYGIIITHVNDDGSLNIKAYPHNRGLATLENCAPLIRKLGIIHTLDLSQCPTIENLNGISLLSELSVLSVRTCTSLHNADDVSNLNELKVLDIHNCTQLKSFSFLSSLDSLLNLDISSNDSLSRTASFGNLRSLQILNMNSCRNLQDIDMVKDMISLKRLEINDCPKLVSLEPLMFLTTLEFINMNGCKSITSLVGLSNKPVLSYIDASDTSIVNTFGLSNLPNLIELQLFGCNSLVSINELTNIQSIGKLVLDECASLNDLDFIVKMDRLETLHFSGCISVRNFNPLSQLYRLNVLYLGRTNFSDTQVLSKLNKLSYLSVSHCQNIENVDGLSGLNRLHTLDLNDCKFLVNIDGLAGLSNLRSLNLIDCSTSIDISKVERLPGLRIIRSRNDYER